MGSQNQREEIYEERCCLFLDILGFQDLIRQGKEQLVYEVLRGIKQLQLDSKRNSMLTVTAFSDSIVISSSLEDPWATNEVIAKACILARQLLNEGILCRGGITLGDLHHKDGIVFGPALNEAHQLESQLAIYPRIVASKTVRDEFEAFLQTEQAGPDLPYFMRVFKKDFDGVLHLNYLSMVAAAPHAPIRANGALQDAMSDVLQRVMLERPTVTDVKADIQKQKIVAKYDWLQRLFDDSTLESQAYYAEIANDFDVIES